MDRVCGSAGFARWPFRAGMAHGLRVEQEEVGSGQGQRHGEICGTCSVGDCCLDSVSPLPLHGTKRAANFWSRRQAQSVRQRAGRSCYPNRTPLMLCSCFGNTFHFGLKPIARRNFRINSQRRANAAPNFRTACGLRPSRLPQNGRRRSPPVL